MPFAIAPACHHGFTWPPRCAERSGCFPCKTMVSELISSIRSKFLDFSSVFTAIPNIPGPAWAWPFANGLSNESAGESGSNPNPAGVQRFTLQPHAIDGAEQTSRRKLVSILLIEDN